jgi:putative transposase
MIDKTAELPITQQCRLLDVSRSGVYYRPVPISPQELELMRQIDEIHLTLPFYGSRNIRDEL